MDEIARYPIGIQTFSEIREMGMIYVDKTALVHRLVNNYKYVFLSRPRRFGKSLLLSTIKAYLEGRKELFDGLAIDRLETKWETHPVLMLSLARYDADQEGSLEKILNTHLTRWEHEYGLAETSDTVSERFHNVILSAYEKTGKRVVILIDEYDAPIVSQLYDEEKQDRMRSMLKSVYTNLKDCDAYIRFAMLTGVSRFSKMTVFSGLNNLKDISLDDRYAEICGITTDELRKNFTVGIDNLAVKLKTDREGAITQLKANYDGYHFTEECPDIYNPYSLLNALDERKLYYYWADTGTPSFLVELIKRKNMFLPEFFNESVEERQLAASDIYRMSPTALLFQTGYLTIKEIPEPFIFRLGVPNKEVRDSLFHVMADIYFGDDGAVGDSNIRQLRDCFRRGDVDGAMRRLKAFLASIPYDLSHDRHEIYFENNLYIIFSLVGVEANTEWRTSDGRIDVVVRVPRFIYVMELKLDHPVTEALGQIERKDYGRQFEFDGRPVIRLGIEFSRKTRNIVSWQVSETE